MSKVTKEEIRRLAGLASLMITEAEIEKRVEELNNVLTYTAMMNHISSIQADQAPIQQTATPTHQDQVRESISLDKVILNAPDRQDFFFKVPRMIGE